MSKKTQVGLIGLFVVGAIALSVAGLLVFGAGGLTKDNLHFSLSFDSSVKGLRIGSPVNFRGVPVGQVSDIKVQVDPQTLQFQVNVDIEILSDTILPFPEGSQDQQALDRYAVVDDLIQKGLRAQLQMQSLVTGQLIIELDFKPQAPARFAGGDLHYKELPTVPSSINELTKAVGELPVKQLIDTAIRAVEGMEKLVNSPELASSIKNLNATLITTQLMVGNLDKRVIPLTENMSQTLEDVRTLVTKINEQVLPISTNIQTLTASAEKTLGVADQTLETVNDVIESGSPLHYDLQRALREVATTARAIRVLAETLETNPDALWRGKPIQGERP